MENGKPDIMPHAEDFSTRTHATSSPGPGGRCIRYETVQSEALTQNMAHAVEAAGDTLRWVVFFSPSAVTCGLHALKARRWFVGLRNRH